MPPFSGSIPQMRLQLLHIDDEPKSAEEYRRVADAHAQTLKDFWKRFAVSGLFVLALVIVLFASLAWFAANNGVGGTSTTLSAKAERYAIGGTSDQDARRGYYDDMSAATGFDTSDSLNVSATYNLNNYTGGSLRPGSYGVLEVTVTPVAKDVRGITLSIERNIKARGDLTLTDEKYEQLQNLFRGHILFFRSKSDDGYYSDPVLDDKLTIDRSDFCAEGSTLTTEPVTIRLYWVWPSQFSSYVLTGKLNYNQNLFASTDAMGYAGLAAAINAHGGWFFCDENGNSVDGVPNVNSNMSAADLQTCADYYNHGDEVLGVSAAYLQIRFVGEEASS